MHWKRAGFVWTLLALFACPALAQTQAVSEKLLIKADSVTTWSVGSVNIIMAPGPVTIETDTVKMSAQHAVIWLTPASKALQGEQQFEIALMGDAHLEQQENHVTRSGPRLMVSGLARGLIRLTSAEKIAVDQSNSSLYNQAVELRDSAKAGGGALQPEKVPPGGPIIPAGGTAIAGAAATRASTSIHGDVHFQAELPEQVTTADGMIAMALSGGVQLTQNRDNGDFLELRADKVVLFSDVKAGSSIMSNFGGHVVAAYLEGDVRINITPATAQKPEQRLTADRCYYDLTTDRAVLTDVVIHTIDPMSQIPIIIRATKARQLSMGEFNTENVQLTSSAFAVPTYSVSAGSAYVHQYIAPDGAANTYFEANDDTFRVFGRPVFYFPTLSGTVNDDAFPLRQLSAGNDSRFGTNVMTEWGLFELMGKPHPEGLDIDFRVDDFTERGLAFGLDATYGGSLITQPAHDPWSFSGDLQSIIMTDKGIDQPGGGDRQNVTPPTELRGTLLWEHEHFFPDDWQLQVRLGYVSDATFLEEYYQDNFDTDLPRDASFYLKRQKDTEAITLLGETETSPFVTSAGQVQNQFDVGRTPELGYRRIGDSFDDDTFTLFSTNSASRLQFEESHATLVQQGYVPGLAVLTPGIPGLGYTGLTGAPVYRADTKQEIDWPVQLGQIKVVPYVEGRVTEYSDSPSGASESRIFGGAGMRMSTAFWKVDDSAESELFDIHRMRNIIEPELNLYTSTSTVDRSSLFIYDPDVDGINDISAAQISLHDIWQTMRGGPGRWRSVDFLEINVEANFFSHKPPASQLNPPNGFRGLFFSSDPEASVPRDGINADATWRVSDATAIFSDAEWNMDQRELATGGVGVAISRDPRLTYYIADEYIQALNPQIVSFTAEYQLTKKYLLGATQSFDFGDSKDVSTDFTLTRNFDTFAAQISIYHDATTNQSGFNLNLLPLGLASKTGGGLNSLQGR